jgi:anti-sigma factor RsiW
MICMDVWGLSSLYLSGELDAARTAEFRGHLETCPACAAEVETMTQIDARLRDAIRSEPADTGVLDARIRQSIAPLSRRWIGLAASLAAAVVIAGIAYRLSGAPERVCADAAFDHRREVVDGQPRKWLSDESSIAALADRRGIAPAAVLQLASAGFHLDRGKLCRLDGRVYLHLVYSENGSAVSVYLEPHEAQPVHDLRTVQTGSEHLAYFESERVSAIVVAEQSSEPAVRMAQAAARVL